MNVDRLFEITFTLVLVYLVLQNATAFSRAVNSLSQTYTSGVKTLQGR
jgi:hypothetical protein